MFVDVFNLSLSLVAFMAAFLLVVGLASRYVQTRMGPQRSARETTPASAGGWPRRRDLAYGAAAFTLVAIYGSLVPFSFQPVSLHEALRQFAQLPMLELGIESRADWVANILLFVPIGFLAMGALNMDHPPGSRWVWSSGLVGCGCLALSIALEFAQIWFPPRTVSQNDIMAETIGAVCGSAVWMAAGPSIVHWLRSYSREGRRSGRLEWLLGAYVIGVLIYSVLPLDLTISPAELYRAYREGKVTAVPLSDIDFTLHDLYRIVRDFVIFVPVGMFVVSWRQSRERPRRSLPQSLALVCGLACLMEMAQFFVYSRHASSTDMIICTAGGLVGALGARRWWGAQRMAGAEEQMGPGWLWGGVAAGYAVLLLTVLCWPGTVIDDSALIRHRYESFWHAPFSGDYEGLEFSSLWDVLTRILLFGVLGSLLFLTVEATTPRGRIRLILSVFGLLGVGAFGIALEMIQVLIPSHIPDITDVALYVIGTLIGMAIAAKVLAPSRATKQ